MKLLAPFCFFAFFLSGFSALIYELTWTRLLKQIFGSDSFAFAAILIVFIGGIAFGSFIAVNLISSWFRFDKARDQQSLTKLNLSQAACLLFLYGISELVLGLYSFFVPFLLDTNNFLQNFWISLASFSLDYGAFSIALKLVLGFLLLLMPTTLIGLGLPILSELLVMHQNLQDKNQEEISLIVSNLYATNTFGAIMGTVISGFVFLPVFGLHNTVLIAALLNIFVFVLSYVVFHLNRHLFAQLKLIEILVLVINEAKSISRAIKSHTLQSFDQVKNSQGYKRYRYVSWILIAIAFALGFINLSLELIWSKVLALIIGSSTYSLTIVLTVVLLGISLGAYLLNYILKLSHRLGLNYLNLLKILLFAFAILLSLSFIFLNNLPSLFLGINKLFSLPVNILKFIYVSLIYLPVTLFEGMIFAFILFLIAAGTDLIDINFLEPVGARVAKINLFNTLGAILGAFLVAFVLMPWFSSFGSGIYFSILFIVFVAYLTVLLVFFLEDKFFSSSKALILLLVLVTGSLLLIQKPMPELFTTGAGVNIGSKISKTTKRNLSQEILFHKEGLNFVVTVVKDKNANAILLKSNGKVEASIPIDYSKPSKADLSTQVLLGTLPMIINAEAKNSLVIGMGSGLSVEALALAGKELDLKQIDVCEIEKVVYEAADKFFVKKYPSGVKINREIADARNFLLAGANSDRRYDIIVSQPSDPWISSNLFTREFWSLASDNLSDKGVFVQWLQLYSIDPEYLTITLRTFASVFEEVLVFKPVNSAELILIGSNAKHKLNLKAAKELIYAKSIRPKLAYIGIDDEADLFASLILVPNSVKALISEGFQAPAVVEDKKVEKKTNKDPNLFKPTLSKSDLTTVNEGFDDFKEAKANLTKVTDDNMLLEFHTYNKLNLFAESIKKNMKFISKYASPEFLIKYLLDDCDSEFLLDLASAHSKANNFEDRLSAIETNEEYFSNLHAKLALGLAEYIHDYSPYPQSFVTLIDIYDKAGQQYKARDLAFDALFQLERYFSFNASTGEPVLRQFPYESVTIVRDLAQLYNLAKIFEYNHDYKKALEIINTALNTLKSFPDQALRESNKKRLASNLYFERAKIYLAINEEFKKQAIDDLNKSFDYDELNYKALIELSKFEDKDSAIRLLKKAMRINPDVFDAHMQLATIYMQGVPDSQIKFMQAINSPNPDKDISNNLDHALMYLHYALQLQPYSLKANYHMLILQNLLGNVDNSHRHLGRLERLCGVDFSGCTDKLTAEEFKNLNLISAKLNKLINSSLRGAA